MKQPVPVTCVVSVIHNRLLCPEKDYREFLDYMTGYQLFWHDVARARVAVDKHLRSTGSRTIDKIVRTPPPEKTDSGAGSRYMRGMIKDLGSDTIELSPLATFQTSTVEQSLR